MRLGHRGSRVATVSAIATLALASLASAQERAGVVTTLEGTVTVARASAPELSPLKFRDAVFVRDRIATGKDSFARILLGGRAVVTIREYSAVTITEVPGVATIDVGSGRVAVAVARERMRPGDLVEVRTPNAVAGIRGTVIVAEVFDTHRSVITVLKGVIDVTRLEAGRLVGPSTVLNALQQVTINAAVSAPQPISTDAARGMRDEFRTAPPRSAPSAATVAVSDAEMERLMKELGQSAATPSLRGAVQAQTDQSGGDSDRGKGTPSGTVVVSTGSSASTGANVTSGAAGSGAPTSAPATPTAPVASAPAPVVSAPAPVVPAVATVQVTVAASVTIGAVAASAPTPIAVPTAAPTTVAVPLAAAPATTVAVPTLVSTPRVDNTGPGSLSSGSGKSGKKH
jgi:FecR protein